MTPERLIGLANPIARFFAPQGERAADGVCDHILKFWDPRMRRELLEHIEAGRDGLDPLIVLAAARLPRPVAPETRQP